MWLTRIISPRNICRKNGNSTDEFYSFKKIDKDVHVLIKIDEKTYHGGANGADHPMAWYHDYDGGRAFYTRYGSYKRILF